MRTHIEPTPIVLPVCLNHLKHGELSVSDVRLQLNTYKDAKKYPHPPG